MNMMVKMILVVFHTILNLDVNFGGLVVHHRDVDNDNGKDFLV